MPSREPLSLWATDHGVIAKEYTNEGRALYHKNSMEEQKTMGHYVYKHIVPDGRYYIGLTSNLSSRWEHKGLHYKNTKLFYPCIKEYFNYKNLI